MTLRRRGKRGRAVTLSNNDWDTLCIWGAGGGTAGADPAYTTTTNWPTQLGIGR